MKVQHCNISCVSVPVCKHNNSEFLYSIYVQVTVTVLKNISKPFFTFRFLLTITSTKTLAFIIIAE